jgi:hypothetical protein
MEGIAEPTVRFDDGFGASTAIVEREVLHEWNARDFRVARLDVYQPRVKMPPTVALHPIDRQMETGATEEVVHSLGHTPTFYAYSAGDGKELWKYCAGWRIKAHERSIIWSLEIKVVFENPLKRNGCMMVSWPSGEEKMVDHCEVSQSTSLVAQQPDICLQGGKVNLRLFGLEEEDLIFNHCDVSLAINYKSTDFREFEASAFWRSSMTGKELMELQGIAV